MNEHSIRLRPVVEEDLAMFRRFATEPGLIGLDWTGFKDPQEPARRYATDSYLGAGCATTRRPADLPGRIAVRPRA